MEKKAEGHKLTSSINPKTENKELLPAEVKEKLSHVRFLNVIARDAILKQILGSAKEAVTELFTNDLKALEVELLGTNPTPLEKILVDRILTCYLFLGQAELTHASRTESTIHQGSFDLKKIDQAHRRYLQAIETLAKVRRLQIMPALQINVAEKQVNVGHVIVSP